MEVCRHSFIYRSLMVPSQHYSQAEVCTLTGPLGPLWHLDSFLLRPCCCILPTFSSWTDGLKCDRFHGQLNEYKAPKLQNKLKSSPVQYQHAWQLTWGICHEVLNMVLSSMAKHLLFGLVCPKTSCGFFRSNLANFSHTVMFFWSRRCSFPATPSNKPYLLKLSWILIVNMLAETCRVRAVALGFFALSENCRESVGMFTPGKIVVFCLQTPECFEIFYFYFSQDSKILLFPVEMFLVILIICLRVERHVSPGHC